MPRPRPSRARLPLFVCASLLAAPAAAQPQPPAPVGPPPAPPAGEAPSRGALFIAPSGEPFRSAGDAPYPVAAWFARADSNQDGRLTRAEFLADADRYFAKLDSNGNGQIDAAEVDAYEAGVLAPLSQRGGSRGGSAGGGDTGGQPKEGRKPPTAGAGPLGRSARPGAEMPRGAGLYSLINSPHPVKAADRDMNSKVAKDEWTRTLSDRFTMLDTAQLGYLTLDTLPKTPVQLFTMGSDKPPTNRSRR